jgi:transcriptional regulator with XRE-family HTH domain
MRTKKERQPFVRRGAETNDIFVEDLRGHVRNAHVTWANLAADANVCVSTVSKFAYGETKRPTFRTVFRIADALGITLRMDR